MDSSQTSSQPSQSQPSQTQPSKDCDVDYCRLVTPKIQFCPECNNMLYPRENKEQKALVYFCRACLYQRKVMREQYCTYVNTVTHQINELALIPSEMIEDPTLARTRSHTCPKCKGNEAVFMQGLLRESDEAMRLYYVCTDTKCKFKWTE